jgi:colanic acid/amylovoran biosynthesis glycosyltransferase
MTDTMRIAYLINQYPKISHVFIRREILALEALGFQVERIALRGWADELVDPQDWRERDQTRYVLREGTWRLLLGVFRVLITRPIRLLRAFLIAWRLGRRADRPLSLHFVYLAEACIIERWLRKAKILHLHAHFGTNSAAVALLVHALGGPKWSFTVHGPEEFDRAPLIGLAEKVRRCSFVVAISSYGRSQLYRLVEQQHWPKIHVVHCGFDSAFQVAPRSSIVADRRLVCVGRLCEQKGQLLLIEAARRLTATTGHFELILAGDGEMRGDIERLVKKYRLDDQIRITGWITGAQVRDEILASRALVLPSFAEGLPVVIMEAMALMRPVISTYVGGIPELVKHGEHGWLVPAGDVDALATAMQTCLEAPDEVVINMGKAARDQALARHDVKTQVDLLAELFRTEMSLHVGMRDGRFVNRSA